MPHWLATLLVIAASITTLAAFAGVIRNKVIRPLGVGYRKLLTLLEQIRDASSGVQRLAREVEGLAGAIANFVVGIHDQVKANTERLDRLEELHQLVLDLDVAVLRITRHLGIKSDGTNGDDT